MVRPADLKTIGEVADILARVDRDRSPAYFARLLRTMVQQRVLHPATYYGEGRTAAAMFGEDGICAARILTTVQRLGLAPDDLEAVYGCLQNMGVEDWHEMSAKGGGLPGLRYVIDRTKAGESWFFVLHLRSEVMTDFAQKLAEDRGDPDPVRTAVFSGLFTKKPDFTNPMQSALTLVSLVFNCKTLFQGLLEETR